MRPVPVTFLRFAFSDQLTMNPCQQLTFGMRSVSGRWKRTLADLSGRVAARGAGLLLVVERAATENNLVNSCVAKVVSFPLPQRSRRFVGLVGSWGSFDLPATSAETVGLGVAGKQSEPVFTGWAIARNLDIPLAEAGGTLRCNRESACLFPAQNPQISMKMRQSNSRIGVDVVGNDWLKIRRAIGEPVQGR